MSARLLNCSVADYFRDPCEVPSLSSSIAHTLVTKSPAHAWTEHPRFGNSRDDPSKAMTEGSLIHKLLLGEGPQLVVISESNYRTKAAREAKQEAIADGKIPVLITQCEEAVTAVEQIEKNLAAFDIKLNGESEIAIEFDEVGVHGPVTCRAMLDNVAFIRGQIYDVKKIQSADPRTCEIWGYRYGMDIQCAAYTSAVEKLKPELVGRTDFLFIFCELDAPWAVVPMRPSGAFKMLGESRWLRAVQTWEQCLQTDSWPSYATTIGTLEPPGWGISQEELENE